MILYDCGHASEISHSVENTSATHADITVGNDSLVSAPG
jgi:hypothetical protein